MNVSVCLCVYVSICLSVREHISGTTRPIFKFFVHVTYDRGLVLLWRRVAIMLRYVLPILWMASCLHDGCMSIPPQRVTSLRSRRAQANGPATSYRLRRVLQTTAGAETRHKFIVQGLRGGEGVQGRSL